MTKKLYFIIPLILVPTVIILSIAFFIVRFWNYQLSPNIQDWGAFGSYMSPIIVFINLIAIGYLTYVISKNSIDEKKKLHLDKLEEDKNLHFLKKKMEVFEELNKYIVRFSLTAFEHYKWSTSLDLEQQGEPSINRIKLNTFNMFSTHAEFDAYISTFILRYNHIFKYNFDSVIFKKLLSDSSKAESFRKEMINDIENKDNSFMTRLDQFPAVSESLLLFVYELKEELTL